jgi:hypothetical protein
MENVVICILRPFGIFFPVLVYLTAIRHILWQLVYLFPFWYLYFSCFGMFYQEKSGNPVFVACLSQGYALLFPVQPIYLCIKICFTD